MAPLTIRYNNPGALEYQPWMAPYGATLGPNSRYAQFASPDDGYKVMGKVLDTYQNKHGLNTVEGIVNRWAPANVDNNSTGTYTQKVAAALGVDPRSPLTPEQRPALMRAMAGYEAGVPVAGPGAGLASSGPAAGSFRAAQETASPQAQAQPMFPQMVPQQIDPQAMQMQGGQPGQGLGGMLNGMFSNPMFLMGASVLGSQNVGQGLMAGAQAANQMQQQAYERQRQTEADQRSREKFPLEKQMLEAQIKKANEPATTEEIKEFQFAKTNGYQGGFMDYLQTARMQKQGGQYGQNGQIFQSPDGTQFAVQFGRDGTLKVQPVTAGGGPATAVSPVGGGAAQGGGQAAPAMPLTQAKGVQRAGDLLYDQATGRRIGNVTDAMSNEAAAKEFGDRRGKFLADLPKHESRIASMESDNKLMNEEIGKAVSLIDGGGVTGWAGMAAKYAPGTAAYNLQKALTTIKAKVGFGALQEMRDNSPTGGALGQVAVQELEALQSIYGSFDQAQDAATLKANLQRLSGIRGGSGDRLRQMLEKERQQYSGALPQAMQAPTQQAAPQATPAGGTQMRWNPATGQLEPM